MKTLIDRKRRITKETWADLKRPHMVNCTVFDRRDYLKEQAIAYAKWLARRDGIDLPRGCTPVVDLRDVYVAGRTEARARAVVWRDYSQGPALVINIPNWDWVPTL